VSNLIYVTLRSYHALMKTDGSLLEGEEKEEYVTGMFNRIARPYDKLNGLISLGRDAKWRQEALSWAGVTSGDHVADLGTGTGDFYLEIRQRVGDEGRVVGIDIAENMLAVAKEKADQKFGTHVDLRLGSAAETGLDDASQDLVTMGWVLRNVADRAAVYAEVMRILKPGGKFLCVDMSKPSFAPIRWASQAYLAMAMPVLIRVAGGDREAYDYLNRSTQKFPNRNELVVEWQAAGFIDVKSRGFMAGSIAAHLATNV
jgi:demethylmenaquinone methyltransferase/2-methoxy-6-polyprenyl-1,4-benzoquinol methylase